MTHSEGPNGGSDGKEEHVNVVVDAWESEITQKKKNKRKRRGTVEKLWGNHEDKMTIRGIKSCKHRSTRSIGLVRSMIILTTIWIWIQRRHMQSSSTIRKCLKFCQAVTLHPLEINVSCFRNLEILIKKRQIHLDMALWSSCNATTRA